MGNDAAESRKQPRFSHLYIERKARDLPMTAVLRERFPRATVIEIDDYKQVFARPGQDFQLQKSSPKLIAAVKKDNLVYPGSTNAQDFGEPNFHYNALVLNCLYNCEYCYLQGMYPSGNVVVFVNTPEFFAATEQAIASRANLAAPLYLAISYDTDLLALESVVPYCREWVEFSRNQPDLLIEIRTKSANFQAIADVPPHPRAVLAWTLSPDAVARRHEHGAPPLARRLASARAALDAGWPVRLVFDPVLRVPDWQTHYRDCFEETFAMLPPERIRDTSVGVFRISGEYFGRMKKVRPESALLRQPFAREGSTVASPMAERRETTAFIAENLKKYVDESRIEIWT